MVVRMVGKSAAQDGTLQSIGSKRKRESAQAGSMGITLSRCRWMHGVRSTGPDSLCKKMSEDLERLEGKRLIDAMETFTLKMCGAVSSSNYAPVVTLIMLIGVLNVKEKEEHQG